MLCALILIWVDDRVRCLPSLLVALLLWGAGCAVGTYALPEPPSIVPVWVQKELRLEGVVDTVQGLPDGRLRLLLREVRPANNPESPPLPGLVSWVWEQPGSLQTPRPVEGQRVRLSRPLRDTLGFRNLDAEDTGNYWEIREVFWRVWSRGDAGQPYWMSAGDKAARHRAALRQKLVDALTAGQPEQKKLTQAQAFLPALLFGDRYHLHTQTMERMAAASLIHSLALSGQHLALAALFGALLARLPGFLYPPLYLRIPYLKLATLCSLPPALIYLWLGGAPASLLRAFGMLVFLGILLWRHRVRTLPDLLLPTLLIITLFHPLAVFDLGLQLSVLCVAAIGLATPFLHHTPWLRAPRIPKKKPPLWRRMVRGAGQILLISLAVQVALLPVFLSVFGMVSPWFALNVLWLPVLGIWVLPLAALGQSFLALGIESSAQPILALATLPCSMLLDGLDWLARYDLLRFPALLRPHWTTLPAWAALVTALALLPGRWSCGGTAAQRRLAMAGMILLLAGPLLRHGENLLAPVRLEMLDVGQGQAVRIALPGGQHLLVDGGGGNSPRFDPGAALVAPRLTHNTAPRVYSVLSTHPDIDHMRGLIHILRSFTVEGLYHNGDAPHSRDARLLNTMGAWKNSTVLHAGMVLDLPTRYSATPLRLEVLHPPPNSPFTGNNNSLVLRLTRGEQGLALLMGDAELPAIRHLLRSGQNLRADVLVLPHHGSARSLLPALYDAVAPQLALVSCGHNNRFGFPAPAVREALRKRGIPLYSTAEYGAVRVHWDWQGRLWPEPTVADK